MAIAQILPTSASGISSASFFLFGFAKTAASKTAAIVRLSLYFLYLYRRKAAG
jgi:hypothetical protein